jgi:spermidine synthase
MKKKSVTKPSSCYHIALVFSLFSGCTALAHELLWTRRLIDLIGATTGATSRVFGCFFLGLAIGSIISSLLSKRIKSHWILIGFAQFGIILFSIPILTIVQWSTYIWQFLGTNGLIKFGGLIKLLLSIFILMPPSIIMGMILPLVIQAALRRKQNLKKHGIWIYAINIAGGVIGIFAVSLLLFPHFGVNGSLVIMLFVNFVLGITGFFIHKKRKNRIVSKPIEKKCSKEVLSDKRKKNPFSWSPFIMAFISGFGILATEILCLHLIRQLVQVSVYPETAVLACVICILAISSWSVPLITRHFKLHLSRSFPRLLFIVGISITAIPFLFFSYSKGLIPIFYKESYISYMIVIFTVSLVTMGPSLFIAGLVFPVTFIHFENSFGIESKLKWGWLLAVNGFGGLLGAEFANYILMPVFGMNIGIAIVGLFYILVSLLMHLYQNGRWTFRYSLILYFLLFLVSVSIIIKVIVPLPLINQWRWNTGENHILESSCGPEGVISVIKKNQSHVILYNNYYSLGGSDFLLDEEKQALLPLMIHPKPLSVATIGIATGITAGTFLHDSTVQSLESIEISGLVIKKAKQYFTESNNNLFNDTRSKIIREDGRIYISAADNQYDIILGDLYLPWGSGEGRLYSVEHFSAICKALKKGGIFCQWLPMHMLTADQFKVIIFTFVNVYKHVYLFKLTAENIPSWIAMVGFKEGEMNWDTISLRIEELSGNKIFKEKYSLQLQEIKEIYLGFVSSDLTIKSNNIMNTLDNAWIEIHASQTQVTRAHKYIKSNINQEAIGRYLEE